MVVIEALASGAMVVGSAIPAIQELIVDGENGLLVRHYEDPQAIANAVRVACTDAPMRHKTMANARKSVEPFEKSKVDALEASYARDVFGLQAAGAFAVPIRKRLCGVAVRRARQARHAVPQPVKDAINAFRIR